MTGKEQTHTGYTARHEKLLRRHARSVGGGFDLNENPVIIGPGATAGGGSTPDNVTAGEDGAVAIGDGADASGGTSCIAIGQSAQADTNGEAVAIGHSAVATGLHYSTAIGKASSATGQRSLAMQENSLASGGWSIAIGQGAHATADDSIAIGDGPTAGASGSVAIGQAVSITSSSYTNSVAIGNSAFIDSSSSVAVGHTASAGPGNASTAVGYGTGAASSGGVGRCTALGYDAWTYHASHSSLQATAVGALSKADYDHAVALGSQANARGLQSIAVGYSSAITVGVSQGIAIGAVASVTGDNGIAIGDNGIAALESVALGSNATTGVYTQSVALGLNATCNANHQIMLGTASDTVVVRGDFDASYLPMSDPGVSGLVWWDTVNAVLAVSP